MAGPDLSVVTAAVDFDSVVGAVLGVFAVIAVVYVSEKAVNILIDFVSYRREMRLDYEEHLWEQDERYAQEHWERMSVQDKEALGVSDYNDWRSRFSPM